MTGSNATISALSEKQLSDPARAERSPLQAWGGAQYADAFDFYLKTKRRLS
jgi:hypothetical protein